MKQAEELHNQSMEIAERAFVARHSAEYENAKELYKEAYILEREAALRVVSDIKLEPTRSILLRSAASLALQCSMFREAEQMLSMALAGEPPEGIANEVRELMEEVSFKRSLESRSIEIRPNELQFAIRGGKDVGVGMAKYNSFIQRIEFFYKMVYRTIERVRGVPFREHGPISSDIMNEYEVFIMAPVPGSFSVTFVIGTKEQRIPGLDDSATIIEEIVDCVNIIKKNDMQELTDRIPHEKYRENLRSLVRHISPDGLNVASVQISTKNQQQVKCVILSPPEKEIQPSIASIEDKKRETNLVFRGILQQADARARKKSIWGEVTIVQEGNREQKLYVPIEKMADIVRPYFDKQVEVNVIKREAGIFCRMLMRSMSNHRNLPNMNLCCMQKMRMHQYYRYY